MVILFIDASTSDDQKLLCKRALALSLAAEPGAKLLLAHTPESSEMASMVRSVLSADGEAPYLRLLLTPSFGASLAPKLLSDALKLAR